MKSILAVALASFLFVLPVLAQEGPGGEQKSPFTPEEGQKLQSLEQGIRQALDMKQHEKALGMLVEEVPIFEAGLARVEKGEVDYGDQKPMAVAQLKQYLAGNWYNQACCLSLLGRKDEAVAALGKAIGFGWLDLEHMNMDKDLDAIRETEGYKKFVEALDFNDVFEVYAPEGVPTASAPLVVVLHPDESNEKAAIERFKPLADALKVVFAFPRAPYTMGVDRFSWGRKSDDEAAALKKALATIEAVKAQKSIDPAKVYLLGIRRGGYFAAILALTKPDIVKGSVVTNAFWSKYYFEELLPKAKEGGAKICFVHGKKDPFFGKAEAGLKQLTDAGVTSKLLPYEGESKLPEDVVPLLSEALKFLGL